MKALFAGGDVRTLSHWMLVVGFPKNRSPYLGQAIATAKMSDEYVEREFGGKPYYCAGYGRCERSASAAFALLRYVVEWRATLIYAGGRLASGPYAAYPVLDTLRCYLSACQCSDHRAHCHALVQSPHVSDIESGNDRYLFPCRLLEPYAEIGQWNPCRPEAVIEARAVERYVDWCPNFDLQSFEKLENHHVYSGLAEKPSPDER